MCSFIILKFRLSQEFQVVLVITIIYELGKYGLKKPQEPFGRYWSNTTRTAGKQIQIWYSRIGAAMRPVGFPIHSGQPMLWNLINTCRPHSINSSDTLARLIFVGSIEILDDIESWEPSGNGDRHPVRTAPEVVSIKYVVLQAIISKERVRKFCVPHQGMDLWCRYYSRVIVRDSLPLIFIAKGRIYLSYLHLAPRLRETNFLEPSTERWFT